MGQTLKKDSGNRSQEIGVGAYLYQAKIKDIEDQSSYPNGAKFYYKSGRQTDLYWIVTLDLGSGWEVKMFLRGWFMKNKKEEIVGWTDKGNAIKNFICAALNVDEIEIDDDCRLIKSQYDTIEGNSIQVIRYFTSKTWTADDGVERHNWNIHDRVWSTGVPFEVIQEQFGDDDSLEYLKDKQNYDPEGFLVWQEEQDKEQSGGEQTGPSEDDDDDLPF